MLASLVLGESLSTPVLEVGKNRYYVPGINGGSILGEQGFIEWVREKLGDRARVEQDKPESRRVFGFGVEEIARVTAKVYGKGVEELRRRRRGEQNEARSMAIYLSRVLGEAQAQRDR